VGAARWRLMLGDPSAASTLADGIDDTIG